MTFNAFKDNLKPWTTFANPMQFSKPTSGEIVPRMTGNLEHFASNYIVIFMIIFFGSLLSTPSFLVSMMLLGVIWWYLLTKKDL
jgi:hypothetical protein